MAFTVGFVLAQNSAAAAIPGGLLSADVAGGGVGPTFFFHGLVDGVAGVNKAAITVGNQLKVDGSGVTLTVASHAVTNAGTFAVQSASTLAAETTKVIGVTRTIGNAGGVMDAAGQNASAPANALQVGGQFNTTPTTITAGNFSPFQLDNAGNLLVNVKAGGAGGGIVTQTTGTNLHMVADAVPVDPFGANTDAASATGSISAKLKGVATALGITALTTNSGAADARTLRVSVDSGQIPISGQHVAAQSVPTVQAGFPYETVAASASNQVLGGAGAAGDYLSHVLISPATAGCGAVTIFDNAVVIASFPGGGTTALPSLAPFVIPVGGLSVSGAWKITTGANVSCTAFGRFT
jgi:hypothetical protein